MRDWLVGLGGEGFATVISLVVIAIVLLMLFMAARLIRRAKGGTFVAGGRNRAPRLAVIDAAAVDNQRRLVLVRRDDVEHLILIGGPTDVVIEPGIKADSPDAGLTAAPAQRPLRKREPAPPPIPSHPGAHTSTRPARNEQPVGNERRVQPAAPAASSPRTEPRQSTPAPSQQASGQTIAAQEPPSKPTADQSAQPTLPRADEIDISFLETLEPESDQSRDQAPRVEPAQRQEISIETEMSRLLDDLSDDRQNKR